VGVATGRQTEAVKRRRAPGANRPNAKKKYARYRKASVTSPKPYLAAPYYASVDLAPEEAVDRAVSQKLVLIQRFVNQGRPRGRLVPYAQDAARIHQLPMPKRKTLYHWVQRYLSFGLNGLVDGPSGPKSQFDQICEKLRHLTNVHVFGAKISDPSILLRAVSIYLSTVEVPDYSTLQRYLVELIRSNRHLWTRAQLGEYAARNQLQLSLGNYRGEPARSRLVLDSTRADLWVRLNGKRERPYLTILEDFDSREFIAFLLSFMAPTPEIVLSLLAQAFGRRPQYQGLPTIPVPSELIVDQGAEHRGALPKRLAELGVKVTYGVPYEPFMTSRAERMIDTVQTQCFAHMPGFPSAHKPIAPDEAPAAPKRTTSQADRESDKVELPIESLLTIARVEKKLVQWAVAYNDRPHSALPPATEEILAKIRAARVLGAATNEALELGFGSDRGDT
jgi:hypothetical protein